MTHHICNPDVVGNDGWQWRSATPGHRASQAMRGTGPLGHRANRANRATEQASRATGASGPAGPARPAGPTLPTTSSTPALAALCKRWRGVGALFVIGPAQQHQPKPKKEEKKDKTLFLQGLGHFGEQVRQKNRQTQNKKQNRKKKGKN